MSNKRFYPPARYKLKATIPLSEYIENEWFRPNSPFRPDLAVFKILRNLVKRLTQGLQSFFRTSLLVEVIDLELSMFRRETRSFLAYLVNSKIIKRWDCGMHNTDLATHFVANIVSGDIVSDDKKVLVHAGAFYGHGSSTDLDEALKIAIAEIIERISASRWNESELLQSNLAELERRGVKHFSRSYFGELNDYDKNKTLGFIPGVDLRDGGRVLLPASIVYLYYQAHHPDEPKFLDVSSNGVATQTSKRRALLGALYESFERDGFLMYWMNSIAPRRIDPDTIQDESVKNIIKGLQEKNFSVYLLDCRTEYDIPIITSVLIDNLTNAVNIHAAAGSDALKVLRKLIDDNQRIDPDYAPSRPSKNPEDISSLYERMHFWHGGHMRKEIDWFVGGETITFADYQAQFSFPKLPFDELAYLKRQLQREGSEAYYYEYKSNLAKVAGLSVVRAIVPDLIPIYFDEKLKHLNTPRLYTFAQKMGYKNDILKPNEINPIPHPFV